MNIFLYLFEKFFQLQKGNMILLLSISLLLTFIYANVSSKINATIIQSIQKNDSATSFLYFWYFIGASVFYMTILFFYRMTQTHLLTNLTNWVKKELFEFILRANNENMKNINFADFITPIIRISTAATSLLNDILSNFIPTVAFLLLVAGYFCWKDPSLGIGFIIGNIIVFSYLFFIWESMYEYKRKQEKIVVENERYILDNLNNIDKVVYRGTMNQELEVLQGKTDECIDFSIGMTQYMTNHMLIMNVGIYIVMFCSLFYILKLHSSQKLNTLSVITFMTLLIMYRDNISDTVHSLPHNMDLMGRIDLILREFNDMIDNEDVVKVLEKRENYTPMNIPFDTVEFDDVSFEYATADKAVFTHYSKELDLKNKIIGITGLSGNGKSSFVKLILRLHDCRSGTIRIDGKDIKTIDPTYIRENITYVNQNSRLFDREILENILYGCKDETRCKAHLKEILSFGKIKELYRNVQLDSSAGPLGENLSGGQRQVANLISGLINPTAILILDEPTNALDPELKREVLALIQQFRNYKKCIMIITHDRDVFSLFDETVEI